MMNVRFPLILKTNVELSLLFEIAFDIRNSTNLNFGLNLIKAI